MAILIYHGKTAHKNSLFIYSRYHDARLAQIFLACCAVAARACEKFTPVFLARFYTELTISIRTICLRVYQYYLSYTVKTLVVTKLADKPSKE